MRRLLVPASGIALVLCLSACGGGGGGSGPQPIPAPPPTPVPAPPPAPPPPPPPPPPTSAEYDRSAAVVAAKAQFAYDKSYTGKGVTIAVIDSGIDTDNPEFAGRISSASTTIQSSYALCGTCPPSGSTNYDLEDRVGHGTTVASVAAAGRNSAGILGVAYDATLMAIKVVAADMDKIENGVPREGTSLNIAAIAPGIRHAATNGAFVINLSSNGAAGGQIAIDQRAAMDLVREKNLVLVQSVSNDPGDSFSGTMTENLVGSDFANKDWFLYGIALDANSNPRSGNGEPGTLADRTLAVVAKGISVIGNDGQLHTVSGNSFAAPAIAGAAALLKQYWPQLGGKEISSILLSTATDLGAPGADQVYGVGLMNIEAAFKAQAPTIGTASIKPSSLNQTALLVSPAFGGSDGKKIFSTAAGQAVAVDRFGRDYTVDMGLLAEGMRSGGISLISLAQEGSATLRNSPREDGLSRTDGYPDARQAHAFGMRLGRTTAITGTVNSAIDSAEMMTGSMLRSSGIATVGTELSLFVKGGRISIARARSGYDDQSSSTRRLTVALADGLTFGLASNQEVGSALGMMGSGAFNIEGARSVLANAGWAGQLAGLDVSTEGLFGRTKVVTRDALIRFADPVLSTGFRVSAQRSLFGGRALFGLTSPLKVERAQLRYEAPTGYDLETRSTIDTVRLIHLAPSARELNLEAGWSRAFREGRLSLGGAYGLNSGNIRGQSSAAGWLRFNSGF